MDFTKLDYSGAAEIAINNFKKTNTNSEQTNSTDLKKYLNTQLPKGVDNGEIYFRILPSKENHKEFYTTVKFHMIKFGGKWRKLYDPAQDGGESPLNDMHTQLMRDAKSKTDAEEAKALRSLANSYQSRSFYIIRGIERGKEAEGVKFWRVSHNFKQEGEMDKLAALINTKEAKNPGDGCIWHPLTGRDIILTLVRDKSGAYTNITMIQLDDPSPISKNEEHMNEWLNDETTWRDVYKQYPTEYLEIVADGGEPVWDKTAKKYVAKTDDDTVGNTNVSQTIHTPPVEESNSEVVQYEPINTDDLPF